MSFVIVIIIVLGFLINLLISSSKMESYQKIPTFEDYKTAHPELVKRGRVECDKCGGTKIYTRGLTSAVDSQKTHFCSTCGKPLYRSQH